MKGWLVLEYLDTRRKEFASETNKQRHNTFLQAIAGR
jgi:hypothetical protein